MPKKDLFQNSSLIFPLFLLTVPVQLIAIMDVLLSPPPLLATLRQEFRQLLQAARQRCIDLYEARSGGSSSDAAAACDLMPIRHDEDHIIADLNALRV